MATEKKKNFEDALQELEDIVRSLEKDELPLEKSLQLYEKGIKLTKFCTNTLEEANLRIKKIHEGGEK